MRLRRALAKEVEDHGEINDGAGKRYMIGPLFVQCGDISAALTHYQWFEENCSDDTGEPIHFLFWVLALHRSGDMIGARKKLLEAMVQNIYLVPRILGLPGKGEDIWHFSNWAEPDYGVDAPPEFVPTLSAEERSWMKEQLASEPFRRVRAEYISTFRALKDEGDVKKRMAILDRWEAFWADRNSLAG